MVNTYSETSEKYEKSFLFLVENENARDPRIKMNRCKINNIST